MKKLMIAAAAAAMIGGAYASTCSDPGPDAPKTCGVQTLVYQWQFKGKTGAGALIKESTKIEGTAGGSCSDGTGNTVITDCEVVRVPGSLAIVAYSYLCDAECSAFEPASQNMLVTPYKAQYYATKPLKSLVVPYRGKNFIKTIDVAHVIGKKANQYELAGTAEFEFDASDIGQKYSLYFAGFGSYDQKKERVSSVSGNFAGLQTPPRYAKTGCGGERCPAGDWWNCCPLAFAGQPLDASVAYGSWSVKFNSSATKKFETNASTYWVK
jgi:hypothetical protein